MLLNFQGLGQEGLTPLHDVGGQDCHGEGRDNFPLLQSNDIFYNRRPRLEAQRGTVR
jgi:hypothetical protein